MYDRTFFLVFIGLNISNSNETMRINVREFPYGNLFVFVNSSEFNGKFCSTETVRGQESEEAEKTEIKKPGRIHWKEQKTKKIKNRTKIEERTRWGNRKPYLSSMSEALWWRLRYWTLSRTYRNFNELTHKHKSSYTRTIPNPSQQLCFPSLLLSLHRANAKANPTGKR